MKNFRTITTIGGLFLTAALALAQVAPVAQTAPPAPAAPPATPRPATAPQALDTVVRDLVDLQLDQNMDFKFLDQELGLKRDEMWTDAQEKAVEKMQEAQDKLFLAGGKLQDLAFQLDQMTIPRPPPVLKTPTMPPIRLNEIGRAHV